MRIANIASRSTLLTEHGAIDVEQASGSRFGADLQGIFVEWRAFRAWASEIDLSGLTHVESTMCLLDHPVLSRDKCSRLV
jgi:hypothetical protein